MNQVPPAASVLDAHAPGRVLWGRALSWAFYDFANTIYSALVVSFAITLHVKEFTGVEKFTFLTMGLSLLCSGLLLPVAGEVADRTGHAKRYLIVLTLVTCASCVVMSAARTAWLILALYFVANFCYNSSLAFYDSLMPTLAPRERLGLISGLGVGLGYAGVAFALPLGYFMVAWYRDAGAAHKHAPLFAVAGVLFLLFSLPLFLGVPERRATKPLRPGAHLLSLAFKRVCVTIRALPRHRAVLLFLLGNFFCVDALNAGIFAYAPYVVNVFGLDTERALLWMLPFSLAAFALGTLGGKLSDLVGSRRTFICAGVAVSGALLICSLTRSLTVFLVTFILLGGFGLSTIWVAGRKMLVELAPPGQIGKYFGLYNVGHKLSMIGVVVFGLMADLELRGIPAGGYRVGMLLQIVLLSVGLVCIYKVEMPDEA
ncbi:MAG: MFS transporter [Planctomycetota bacterium]|jgi:UMF1 family MFS transporter